MRVFLAIDFQEHIKDRIIREIGLLKQKFPEFKWIKSPSLHLTLKFLGETDPNKIIEITNLLKNAFNYINPFNISTTNILLLPTPNKARVLYLGLEKTEPLIKCYNIIEEKIKSAGFEKENKNFNPHITLARIKNRKLSASESSIISTHSIPKIGIKINKITLMQSELLPLGARYTSVQRFSLRSL